MKYSSEDYGIYNEMEEIVDLAINQVLSEDSAACDCPQCHADIKCLILNRLEARYRVEDLSGKRNEIKLSELERNLFNKVVAESYRALIKVKAEPRHDINRTFLVNSIERIVVIALNDILKQEQRELDYESLSIVMARTLNSLAPRYTTTQKGQVFCRAVEIDPAYLAELYSAIFNALGSLSVKSSVTV